MPNHVTNELIFLVKSPEHRAAIMAALCNVDGQVDFNVLVPVPLNCWWGSVSADHEKAFKRTALDWSRENWGTKWNAYDQKPIKEEGDVLTFVFDTAWSPPYPWLAAVFNVLKCSFEHNWFDEGASWAVEGRFDAAEMDEIFGCPWREQRASDETQKRLHMLKWGCESFPEGG